MRISRRKLLQAGAIASGVAAAGCSPGLKRLAFGPPEKLAPPPEFSDPDAVLLNRIGFGPAPGELEKLKRWAGRNMSTNSSKLGSKSLSS